MLNNFTHAQLEVNGVTINLRHGGKGPPLLLLHGYPQTHVIWHPTSRGPDHVAHLRSDGAAITAIMRIG